MIQKINFSLLLMMATCMLSAQTDPANVPKPPAAQLAKYKPFLGKWRHTMNYAGMKWSGKLEIKPAIKGWYIERTILTKTSDGKIDREFRSMITWDASLGHYRIWRFETLPPAPAQNGEGKGYFDGNTLIEEWEFVPGTKFRNRISLLNKNEMKIVTEEEENGQTKHIGVTIAKRILK